MIDGLDGLLQRAKVADNLGRVARRFGEGGSRGRTMR